MGARETDTGGGMTMEEGRVDGRQAEATIVRGKMIEVVEEETGLEIIIMVRIGKIRGENGIEKSHLHMKEETAKGGGPISNHEKQPNRKAVTPGKV